MKMNWGLKIRAEPGQWVRGVPWANYVGGMYFAEVSLWGFAMSEFFKWRSRLGV
jgi:hypothetical protein